MSEVTEQKYLGFVISSDVSNNNNIEAKKKRAIGITKHIQYLIKHLGKFTIECGIIYLNSLNRSCQQLIDNEHLIWCSKMNSENDFRYSHILNGNLEEKIKTLEQIKHNEKRRNTE